MSQPVDDLFRCGHDPDQSIWLLLPSRLELLGVVDGLVAGLLNHLETDEEVTIAVATSVIEAGTNAIQHGHRQAAEKSVRFCFRFEPGSFEVWVTDTGAGFDLASIHVSDPTNPEDLLKARGRGIFIMRSMMDEVDFDIRPGVGTTVHLRKRWAAAASPDASAS
jgi:serine/threonine-protein kinase RsbW